MARIIFKTIEKDKIMEFKLDLENQEVLSISIENGKDKMAKMYYPEINNMSYSYFEKLMQYYCDTNYDLNKILSHINKNGFYTPYRPTLRVDVLFENGEMS